MTRPRAERTALAIAAVTASVTVSGLVLLWLNRPVIYGNDVLLFCLFTATTLAYTAAGFAIVRRAPVHVIGWLCLGTGFVLELGITLTQYGLFALATRPGSLPAPALGLVVANATPLLTLTGIMLIAHLFPTGRPVAPRWRWLVAATVAGQTVALVTTFFLTDRITDIWSDELSHAGVSTANPLAIGDVGIGRALNLVGVLLFVTGAVGAVVSLFVRRRRATSDERRQIRWLAAVGEAALGWIVLMLPVMLLTDPNGPAGAAFWLVITPLVALGPPAAIGIGIVKYRAFDIDVVIRKTVVVAVIAFTLTVLYLGVIALATVPGAPRLLVGAALLVVTFNPVRRAARSIADRVAYGRRASSYEVLSDFSDRMAETYASDDVLPRMATILASGTGAATVTVWLRIGDELRPAASAGDAPSYEPVRIAGDALPALGPGEAVEIRHRGELLGALSLSMPANDPLDPARRQLVQDIASQAGLVLRNVRLIEELRASRQRLVVAQDEERRRIERNIHDGAQQQLVALGVKLRLARQLAERDPVRATEMLEQLQADSAAALEDLRDLARGIYPPLLADKGLPAALEAQARKAAVPTTVHADGIDRYPREIEATVYFCALEALNNVAKYAGATHATIRLERADGRLVFTVTDDGQGFDATATSYGTGLRGMADRIEASGGSLEVTSAAGEGTTLRGSVPVTA
ncbi:MAG: histidine kinase [Planctomycetaceae bacterium]